jgi:hypothetical protein
VLPSQALITAGCGALIVPDGPAGTAGGLRAHDSEERGSGCCSSAPPACPDYAIVLNLTVLFGQAFKASETIARSTSS